MCLPIVFTPRPVKNKLYYNYSCFCHAENHDYHRYITGPNLSSFKYPPYTYSYFAYPSKTPGVRAIDILSSISSHGLVFIAPIVLSRNGQIIILCWHRGNRKSIWEHLISSGIQVMSFVWKFEFKNSSSVLWRFNKEPIAENPEKISRKQHRFAV